jgi:hypothetical protein
MAGRGKGRQEKPGGGIRRSFGNEFYLHTIDIPEILFATEGFATAMPPTALVTETAGVKTPSAIVNPVPRRLWYTSSEAVQI